jgi:hypothetical protein
MATLTLNTITGQIDAEIYDKRMVQTGIVEGLDTSVDEHLLLWQVLQVLAANNYTFDPPTALDPTLPNIILRRVRVVGVTADTCLIALYWQTPDLGPPTIFSIRNATRLASYQTDLLPGTRKPLRIPDVIVKGGYTVPGDNVLFNFLRPLEEIGIYSLTYGSPRVNNGNVGRVNDRAWPNVAPSLPTFGGHKPNDYQKNKGYWLLSEWTTDTQKYSGYYSTQGSAVSRVNEDWSESGMLIDRATGKRVELIDSDATATAMMAPEYSYGIIYASEGMIRVGPYDVTNFSTIFGF